MAYQVLHRHKKQLEHEKNHNKKLAQNLIKWKMEIKENPDNQL